MMPPHPEDHRAARLLQQACVAVLAALALWALLALVAGLHEAVAMRTSWLRVEGVYGGFGGEARVEVELHPDAAARLPALPQPPHPTIYEQGHVRVLLPERPYTWLSLAGPVALAVRPGAPGEVVIVDALADTAMALSQAAWAAVLGALAGLARRRLDWGRSATWDGTGWSAALPAAWPPGSRAAPDQSLHEARKVRRWGGLLTALCGALLAGHLASLAHAGLQATRHAAPIEAGFGTLVLGLVFAIGIYQVVLSRTRRVQWDDIGVADTSWFRTRRLPWGAIARWQRENTAAAAQRRHDQQSLARRKGFRPADHWVWRAEAASGERLLEVDESMEPPEAQAALRRRIEQAVRPHPPPAFGLEEEAEEADDHAPSAEELAQWQRHEAAFDEQQAEAERGLRWGYLAVVAPFLLMFLWPTWNAIGYQFLAERVEGVVVAAEQGTEVPQLTVRYPGPDGRSLELRTDGSRAHQGVAEGARITVLRPRAAPAEAKVAEFWEVWIWPVISGVLLLVVAVPFYIGFIHGPRQQARRRAARQAGG